MLEDPHAVVPTLPLWIDEGLAEYFEVARGHDGRNAAHIELLNGQLSSGAWRPQLSRLEQLTSATDMPQTDYAEAWLWTHFLLETTPQRRELLQGYLSALRSNGSAAPLSEPLGRSMPDIDSAVVEYLAQLKSP